MTASRGLQRLARAIAQSPRNSPVAAGVDGAMRFYSGIFQGSETVDSNLSRITIGSNSFRFVPRLSGAWSSPPNPGTTLLIGSLKGSLIILGAQAGDVTKAVSS
jgi:hypothetical protein